MKTVATFVAELSTLAEHCEFGTSLDQMLRDWLVCGANSDANQQKLLAESKRTFATALEIPS